MLTPSSSYVPNAHGVQVKLSTQLVPAGHSTHGVPLSPSWSYMPAPHCAQAVAPSPAGLVSLPDGQSAQALLPSPWSSSYLPLPHSEQDPVWFPGLGAENNNKSMPEESGGTTNTQTKRP